MACEYGCSTVFLSEISPKFDYRNGLVYLNVQDGSGRSMCIAWRQHDWMLGRKRADEIQRRIFDYGKIIEFKAPAEH